MGAVGPIAEESAERLAQIQAPGYNLGRETPGDRRRRERTHRNPYFTEDFLEVIATIYEWQTVQKWMGGSHPYLSSPDFGEFGTPEKMRRALLQNGAEPWMFEEVPPPGRERMAFFSEKSTPERRWRVFPYGAALKPWHIEEIRNGRDPFLSPYLDESKEIRNPEDWQDFAITDRTHKWDVGVSPHPQTKAPIYSFNLPMSGHFAEPGTPWYGGDAIESVGFTDLPRGAYNVFRAGFDQRGRQRDESMLDHAAAVRKDPRYNAAYFAEMQRVKAMSPEEREALYDDAEDKGFNAVFGTEDVLRELRPGHFTAVSSLGAMIPGTEAHRRDPGTAELGVMPTGLGTESGVPQSRGSAGSIAERLAVAEAGEYMARRSGLLQKRLEDLEHERGEGRVSEEDSRRRSAELLRLPVPESPPQEAAPAPGQAVEAPAAPAQTPTQTPGSRSIDLTPRKRWYEVE